MTAQLPLLDDAFPVRSLSGDNLWLHHAIYAAAPGDVLVVDVGASAEFGYWGEVMTVAAQSRGLSGLVINGGVRDVQRMLELEFPVFAATACIRGTGKDVGTSMRLVSWVFLCIRAQPLRARHAAGSGRSRPVVPC